MKSKPLYQDILERIGEDDISIIRRVISNYAFIDYGIVQEYSNGRIKVKLAHTIMDRDVLLINIEVLTTGSKAFSIRHKLVKGDIVQLVSSRSLVDSVAELTKAILSTAMPYSAPTIKAIPLANFANAKNKLDVLDDGSYKMTGNGYTVEVTTGGTIKINGQAIELNGNTKQFITWTEFNTAYQAMLSIVKAHVHPDPSSGVTGPSSTLTAMTSDISAAKTTTVKTGG